MNNDRPSSFKRWLVMILLTLLVFPPLAIAGWTWISLHYVYARGERSGYVQKISLKGWAFKTWEGELAMVNLPGTMPQIFSFTVPSADVAQQIEKSNGQRVVLSYDQHVGLPGTCFGDTEYFVTAVRPAQTSGTPAGAVTAPTSIPTPASPPSPS